ncbi:MAG: hypothetical protein ACHQAX_09270 [Gammaproteobacteria bacterium]
MAVRLSIPPKSPIQGRTAQGLGLEQAIFDTTASIRRSSLPENTNVEQKQVRKSPVSMLD